MSKHIIAIVENAIERFCAIEEKKKLNIFLFGTVGLLYILLVLRVYEPYTYLKFDCPYYAAACISLVEDGDLKVENQIRAFPDKIKKDIYMWHKKVPGQDNDERNLIWGFTSLGKDGNLYPKHSFLISIFSIPFFSIFGWPGFLIFNIVIMMLLVLLLSKLTNFYVKEFSATLACVYLALLSFMYEYVYYFSADAFSTMLVLLGLLIIIRGKDVFSGLAFGLAIWAKLTNIIFIPFLAVYSMIKRGPKAMMLFLLLTLIPLLFYGYLNYTMFGSPFITSYDRVVKYNGDKVTVQKSQRRLLYNLPLWKGVFGQLLYRKNGLIFTAPFSVLGLIGFFTLFKKNRLEVLLVIMMMCLQFIIFSKYSAWTASHYGNRYLMTFVCLSTIPLAETFSWFFRKRR